MITISMSQYCIIHITMIESSQTQCSCCTHCKLSCLQQTVQGCEDFYTLMQHNLRVS